MLNSINSLVNFVQIWQKVISLVTMATNVDSKLLTIVFLFLSGTDHSVKVSSDSESVRAGALLEFFGGYRELMLRCPRILTQVSEANYGWYQLSKYEYLLIKCLLDICISQKKQNNTFRGVLGLVLQPHPEAWTLVSGVIV